MDTSRSGADESLVMEFSCHGVTLIHFLSALCRLQLDGRPLESGNFQTLKVFDYMTTHF